MRPLVDVDNNAGDNIDKFSNLNVNLIISC